MGMSLAGAASVAGAGTAATGTGPIGVAFLGVSYSHAKPKLGNIEKGIQW